MDETPARLPAVQDDGWCFVCGFSNPSGLKLPWTIGPDGTARARFKPERDHQGWTGVVHGGILSALLDEAMAQTLRGRGVAAMTVRLEVRFRSPLAVGCVALVEGRVESAGGRGFRTSATVSDAETGRVFAEGNGVCLGVKRERSGLEGGVSG